MRKKISIFLSLVLIIALAVSVLPGCAKKVERKEKVGEKPSAGGIYVHPLYADPPSLDPPHIQESEGFRVAINIFEGLVKYDPQTLEAKPALAESWDVNDDATVWTFYLKKGVKFHNGREVKASDFKWAWERAVAKETQSEVAYILAPIKGYDEMQEGEAKELEGVKVIDDYTLEVTLKYPFAEFIQTLGHPVASVYPKEEYEKYRDKFSEHPVGTGPFKFVEWKHNEKITILKNDDYWGEKAYLDKVVFRIFGEGQENTAFLEYKAGNLHDAMIPTGQYKATKEDPNLSKEIYTTPELAIYFYGFNMEKGPFAKDKNLRLALEYATNREAVVNTVMEGLPTVATGIVPRGIPGYRENQMEYKYHIDEAKKYLAKTEVPEELTLTYNTSEGHQKVAEAIQAGYKEAGINISLTNLEWGTYLDKLSKGELYFYRLGWIADDPSMDNFLYPLFHSSEKGNNNLSFYENPEVDKLLEEARRETNGEKRHELYAKAEKKVLEDAAIIPIYFYTAARVVKPEVQNYNWNAMGLVDFSKIWLKK